ncbi:sulfurtransferase [Halosolutus gelatinilyticus]|uniref:sulfurtransferase n=1 Tax=Halosolutus gelatinilyticus TaxID=2931975 RepID=UPI003CE57E70
MATDYPTTDSPSDFTPQRYEVSTVRTEIRATITEVEEATHQDNPVISVRNPKEHTGSLTYTLIWATLMVRGELSATAVPRFIKNSLFSKPRIRGSKNIPFETIVDKDGTLRPIEELRSIVECNQLNADQEIIIYCAAGYRSSLFWFVLSELLGFDSVRNYDGSWVEWGSQKRR